MNEDVVGVIAEFLRVENDHATLQSLSLASRVCREPAQEQIFHDIALGNTRLGTLTPSSLPERLVSLRLILLSNPHIGRYARSIHITESPVQKNGRLVNLLWIMQSARTIAVLLEEFMPSPIQEIKISRNDHFVWTDLDERLQKALLQMFRKSTFKRLMLPSISFPPYFLSPSTIPNVQQLHIVDLTIPQLLADNDTEVRVADRQPLAYPLTRLSINLNYASTVQSLSSTLIRSGLVLDSTKALHFRFQSIEPRLPDLPEFKKVEELHISFVDHFDFGPGDYMASNETSWRVDLTEYLSIYKLELHHHCISSLNEFGFMTWISNTLASIPSGHPNLRQIHVKINFEGCRGNPSLVRLRELSEKLYRLVQESNGVLKRSAVTVYVRLSLDSTMPPVEAFKEIESCFFEGIRFIGSENEGTKIYLRS